MRLIPAVDAPHSNMLQPCLMFMNQPHVPLSVEILGKEEIFFKDTAVTPSSILREIAVGLLTSREDSRF